MYVQCISPVWLLFVIDQVYVHCMVIMCTSCVYHGYVHCVQYMSHVHHVLMYRVYYSAANLQLPICIQDGSNFADFDISLRTLSTHSFDSSRRRLKDCIVQLPASLKRFTWPFS